jgi:hypothetical protein
MILFLVLSHFLFQLYNHIFFAKIIFFFQKKQNKIKFGMTEWNSGPDTLYPANSFISTKLNEGVLLRSNDDIIQIKPISIYTKFKNVVDEIPMYPALGESD